MTVILFEPNQGPSIWSSYVLIYKSARWGLNPSLDEVQLWDNDGGISGVTLVSMWRRTHPFQKNRNGSSYVGFHGSWPRINE